MIDDEDYWQRCCKARWSSWSIALSGGSWKRYFFETNLQRMRATTRPNCSHSRLMLSQICSSPLFLARVMQASSRRRSAYRRSTSSALS